MRICLGLSLLLLLGCVMPGDPNDFPGEYLSIEELHKVCRAPGVCGKKMDCEGQIVRVKGYVDYDNVFDKKSYPQLPYEKFKIGDRRGNSLEAWAVSDDNEEIFRKIHSNKTSLEKMVFVKGTLTGFDMPIMGTCRRGIAINIKEAKDIFFR